MTAYIVRRLLGFIPTALILLFLIVAMVRLLPGDAIDVLLQDQIVSRGDREQLERQLGLDAPLPMQYARYVGNAVRGDLGTSLQSGKPIAGLIRGRVPITAELAVMTLSISLLIAIPLGTLSAIRQDSILDYGLRSITLAAISIPTFAIGTMVLVLPAKYFGWTPPLVYTTFADDPVRHITQFFVPSVILGLVLSGSLTRMTRTMLLEVLRQDYIRTARAKGVKERSVLMMHALRNAAIPVVSILGLQVAALASGSVIIESLFPIPGMGRLLIQAVNARDYPLIQGIALLFGLFVMAVNLVVDLSYVYLDPRVRLR